MKIFSGVDSLNQACCCDQKFSEIVLMLWLGNIILFITFSDKRLSVILHGPQKGAIN